MGILGCRKPFPMHRKMSRFLGGANVERCWKIELLKQRLLFWGHKEGYDCGSTLNQSLSKSLALMCNFPLCLQSEIKSFTSITLTKADF